MMGRRNIIVAKNVKVTVGAIYLKDHVPFVENEMSCNHCVTFVQAICDL